MAETVLGRVSRPNVLAGPYSGLCREASRQTSRRYRIACRRAGRAAFWNRIERRAAVFLTALWRISSPFQAAGAAAVYIAAGCAERLRFSSYGKSFRFDRKEGAAAKKRDQARINTALAFSALCVLVFTASIYRIGLEVIMDGESIGYVSSESVLEASLSAVSERAGEILGRPYTISPNISYRFSIVSKNKLFDSKGVEESLLSSISDIDRLCVLTIDGEAVAAAWTPAELRDTLDAIRAQYPPEGNTGFLQDVSIQSQLASVSLIRKPDELLADLTRNIRDEITVTITGGEDPSVIAAEHGLSLAALQDLNPGIDLNALEEGQVLLIQKAKPYLSVVYTEQISYIEPIPYETEYIDDPTLWSGEMKTVTEGVDGEALVKATETSIDGYAPGIEINGSLTVTEPVSKVIAVGSRVRQTTGTFIRPYDGIISSSFGWRFIFGGNDFHSGTDFAGPIGDPIVASDGGTVVFAGTKSGYGLCVIIDHKNGYTTLYGHCSKLLVTAGQQVGQGELIAKVGNTGRSTGPHVHFEVRVNGVAKNPMNYIKKK